MLPAAPTLIMKDDRDFNILRLALFGKLKNQNNFVNQPYCVAEVVVYS